MPKLPPVESPCCVCAPKFAKFVLNVVFVAAGDAGVELLPEFSKSWFAGDDMIDRDVIKDEITSGEAGCTCTRFEACAEGP